MSLLSTFTTNSINILAGINGSEVSQAVIIGMSVIINDLLYLPWPIDFRIPLHLLGNKAEVEFGGVWSAGMAHGSRELVERHLFSLYFMLPLVAVCVGFLYHNWCAYPKLWLLSPNNAFFQVPRAGISRRHPMLLNRDGIFSCWYSGPFLENSPLIFHSTNLQFYTLLPTTIWARSMPPA